MEQLTETRPIRRHQNKADVVQKRRINRLLEENLIVEAPSESDAGMPRGKFKDGWSDERIAQEVGVNPKSVESIRRRAFCSLTGRAPDKLDAAEDRLVAFVKSEIATVLDLIAAKPGSGGGVVNDERLRLVIDRVNALDESLGRVEGKLEGVRAQMTSIAADNARLRSEIRSR